MSEHKKPRKKTFFKKSKPVKDDPSFPVEVVIYDCVMHERCIAEYKNESKWWFGTRLYKVYHPNFTQPLSEAQALTGEMGYRWVSKLGKVLGAFDPAEPVATLDDVAGPMSSLN